MLYRKLDQNGDYSFGRGVADFYRDQPEAPAQAVKTRLHLEEGEWPFDLREGTPWQTEVLGKRTENTRDVVVLSRTLGTQGVKAVLDYFSDLNRDQRAFAVQMKIDTIYGPAEIKEAL